MQQNQSVPSQCTYLMYTSVLLKYLSFGSLGSLGTSKLYIQLQDPAVGPVPVTQQGVTCAYTISHAMSGM